MVDKVVHRDDKRRERQKTPLSASRKARKILVNQKEERDGLGASRGRPVTTTQKLVSLRRALPVSQRLTLHRTRVMRAPTRPTDQGQVTPNQARIETTHSRIVAMSLQPALAHRLVPTDVVAVGGQDAESLEDENLQPSTTDLMILTNTTGSSPREWHTLRMVG